MIYFKSFIAGAAAFIGATVALSRIARFVMTRYPQLALRVLGGQKVVLRWISFYRVTFPYWQIMAVGAVAFIIAFAWMLRQSTRTAR